MNIQLDSDMMKSLVSEALLKSLDQEKRDTLIKGAIQHLLTAEKGSYGYVGKTPLQQAFESAIYTAAQVLAREELGKDEALKAKIRDLLNEALVCVMETNREKTVQQLAAAITKGFAYKED